VVIEVGVRGGVRRLLAQYATAGFRISTGGKILSEDWCRDVISGGEARVYALQARQQSLRRVSKAKHCFRDEESEVGGKMLRAEHKMENLEEVEFLLSDNFCADPGERGASSLHVPCGEEEASRRIGASIGQGTRYFMVTRLSQFRICL
jgi:hypothetical protein